MLIMLKKIAVSKNTKISTSVDIVQNQCHPKSRRIAALCTVTADWVMSSRWSRDGFWSDSGSSWIPRISS